MNPRKKRYPRRAKKNIDRWYIRQYYELGWQREIATRWAKYIEKARAEFPRLLTNQWTENSDSG